MYLYKAMIYKPQENAEKAVKVKQEIFSCTCAPRHHAIDDKYIQFCLSTLKKFQSGDFLLKILKCFLKVIANSSSNG